jgi:hypothetical protein
MTTKQNYDTLRKFLSELVSLVRKAQGDLKDIEDHLDLAHGMVITSVLVNDVEFKFDPSFEASSGPMLTAVTEIAKAIITTCEAIGEIEKATEDLAIGAQSSYSPAPTKRSFEL